MRKYSEKIHRERLKKMLKRKDPCGLCPAAKYYDSNRGSSGGLWKTVTSLGRRIGPSPCRVCLDFVDLQAIGINMGCPCGILGRDKALATTYKKMETEI